MGDITKTLVGSEIVFNDKADKYNTIRKKYLELSVEAKEKVSAYYDDNIKSIDDYRNGCFRGIADIYNTYLKAGVIELISHGIYDVDEVVLDEETKKDFASRWRAAFNDVSDQLNRIDLEQIAADEERKDMIHSAGDTVHTVGFMSDGNPIHDLGTMASSAASDMAVNAVLAGGTALITAGFRKMEKKQAEKDKQDIFERGSTKQNILIGIEEDVAMLHRTVARIVNERNGECFYYISEENKAKNEPIVRNILAGNFNYETSNPRLEADKIKEILTANPYEIRIYSYVMKNDGCLTAEMKDILNYLCIDMATMADHYLRGVYSLLDYNTYEDVCDFEEVVKKEMEPFGVDNCKFLYEVQEKRQRLFDIRRTFRGNLYETIELKELVEEQYNNFFAEDENPAEMELDELVAKYYSTLDESIYEHNREDLQIYLMGFIDGKMDVFKESVELNPYIEEAQAQIDEHNCSGLSLMDSYTKKLKRLISKEKFNEGVANAKAGAMAAGAAAMNMGKGLVSKMPFAKKNAEVNSDAGSEKKAENDVPAQEAKIDSAASDTVTASMTPSDKGESVIGSASAITGTTAAASNMAAGATAAASNVAAGAAAGAAAAMNFGKGLAGKLPFGKKNESEAAPTATVAPATVVPAETPTSAAPESVATSATVVTPAPVQATKACPQCGNTVKDTAKFCGKCGFHF